MNTGRILFLRGNNCLSEGAIDAQAAWEEMKSAITSDNFKLWKSLLFSLIEKDCCDVSGSEDILMCTLEAWELFEEKAAGLSSGYSLIVLRELFDLNCLMLETPEWELDEKRKLHTRFFNVEWDGTQFKHLETTRRLDSFITENRTVFDSLSVAKDIFVSGDFSSWLDVIQEHYFSPLDKIYRKGLFSEIKDRFYFDSVVETFHTLERLLKTNFSEEMKKDLYNLHKSLFNTTQIAKHSVVGEVKSQYFKYVPGKGIELLDF